MVGSWPVLFFSGDDGKSRVSLLVTSDGTSLSLKGKDAKSRATLTADDGSALLLFDKDDMIRAALGRTSLDIPRTGAVEQRATSSLVLFDKDGKVIWKAP